MINNKNYLNNEKRIRVKQSPVYTATEATNKFSHHASITYYKNKFYAMWSSGAVNEDDVGQYIMMSVSEDGDTWSDPCELFSPIEGNSVLTAAGWYIRDDGAINAYAGLFYYPFEKRKRANAYHLDTTLLCKTSDDGAIWSNTIDLHIPVVPNQGPQKLADGRLIMCGNVTFPYTDDPKGIDGWTVVGIDPWPAEGISDDSEGLILHGELRNDGFRACEGSYFQAEDGRIDMILRNTVHPATTENRYLLLSQSYDNGESYSDPVMLDFTNNNSKFYCMRLSDGRYAMICNPRQLEGSRLPLCILTSADGKNFSTSSIIADTPTERKFEGMCKGGNYAYPHAVEVNGRLYIICTIQKEDVCVFSFELSELN